METKIYSVYDPNELELAKMKQMDIRFDCIVTAYDCGVRETGGGFLMEKKQLPPQWFAITHKFTLEAIKHGDEYSIGRAMKSLFYQLEDHIKKYEQQKL